MALFEVRPVKRTSDAEGNVEFVYGATIWRREIRNDGDIADALFWVRIKGASLWIDGKVELYSARGER